MSNRANFILHLVLSFFMVLLSVLSAVTFGCEMVYGGWYERVLSMACVPASMWLFGRMVIHCIAAVGREVDAGRRREQQSRELRAELDATFERSVAPYRNPKVRSGR